MVDRYEWTDEAVERLKRCIDEKMSGRATAAALGCSLGAAVGRAARLGLRFNSDHPRNAKRVIEARAATAASAEPDPTPFTLLAPVVSLQGVEIELNDVIGEPKPEPEPQTPAEGVTIHDLSHDGCRAVIAGDCWAADTIRYCGQPKAKSKGNFSFCAGHAEVYLTTPAKERARLKAEAAD